MERYSGWSGTLHSHMDIECWASNLWRVVAHYWSKGELVHRSSWTRSAHLALGGITIAVLASGVAHAGELAYGGAYIGEYSTNVARTVTGEREDWINSALVGMAYRERSSTLTADFYGQAEYRAYKKDTFDSTDLYYVAASGVWAIEPKQFYWTLGDLLRQVLIDPAAPDVPSNRVTVNVFNTGPDALARINPSNTLAVGLRYGNDTYSDHRADADRYGAYVRWLHNIGTRATVSGNVDAVDVNFRDPAPRNDYRLADYYLGLTTRSPTFAGTLDLGYTVVNELPGSFSSGDKTSEGYPLVRLSLTRQITRDRTAGIAARAAFSDAGAALIGRQTELGVQPPGGTGYLAEVPIADPYFEKRGEVFFLSKGSGFLWDARALARRLEYQHAAASDRDETIGLAGVTYLWSLVTSTVFYGEYIRREYDISNRIDVDSTVSLRFSRRLTRSFSLALEGKQVRRNSTDPLAEYVDYRGLVSILYSTGPLYVPERKL